MSGTLLCEVIYDKKVLETIGKKVKKNSVAHDIVDYGGEGDEKPEKLEALLASVSNSDSSHIVHVPAGPNVLLKFTSAHPYSLEIRKEVGVVLQQQWHLVVVVMILMWIQT